MEPAVNRGLGFEAAPNMTYFFCYLRFYSYQVFVSS